MLSIDEATDGTVTATRLKYLEPGLRLRISDLRDSLGGYACSVVETGGEVIWIDLPIRRDGMLQPEPGQLVSVRFDRPGDAVYLFDTAVDLVRDDDEAPFGLHAPLHIDRRPHRAETRLAMVLDATYETAAHGSTTAKVVDLSAGGLGLICCDELTEGAAVTVHCTVPGPSGDITLDQPALVRSRAMYGRTPGGMVLHQYGLEFVDGDEDLREQILESVIWNLTQNPEVL